MRHTAWTTLTLTSLFLAVAGCQYNGALGLSSKDKAAAVEYQKFLDEQKTKREQADLAQRRREKIQFQDGAVASQPGAYPTTDSAYTTGVPATAVMGLYGVVDRPVTGSVSPLDGAGNLRRVTATLEGADFDPAIHPSGRIVAYASTRHRATADIYVKSVDGAAVTQITNDPADDVMPTFSPDGSKVAFCSNRSGNWDIYIMDAGGGQALQLTSDPTHDIHPSFSPDGRRLVYCSYGEASGQWELVVIELDRPTSRKIIGNGLFPEWHPAEDTILFQRARQRGTRWFSVWKVDLVSGEAGAPTELAASANAACITPSWSDDGRSIVFCTVIDPGVDEMSRPGQADIWVMAADGSQRSKLTQSQFANLQPVWSPDGSIVFVSNRGPEGAENLWAMRPDRAMQLVQHAQGKTTDYAGKTPAPGAPTASVPTSVE